MLPNKPKIRMSIEKPFKELKKRSPRCLRSKLTSKRKIRRRMKRGLLT